ncbi:alanine dehydrogenase [Candidatus Spongiisocius sp.]|uniref:alanine dehydrogenase n=1 Tax=Candidatus Spongiisocius sp. TaxID=3101273 RepID=UPI003B5C8920
MRIGIPTETKPGEYRVALTPAGVEALAGSGHRVLVQEGAGLGSYISDDDYAGAGASIVGTAADVWSGADLIVKVKEPQEEELPYLSHDQILFTFLHLAAYPRVASALCAAGTTSVAYETVRLPGGALPLLAPMSEVAGRMATQVGARFLEKSGGGRGVLLSGVPGVEPADVVVIGGGMAGANALRVAVGMGANVKVFDLNPARLREIDNLYRGAVTTLIANRADVRAAVLRADLVIGAVLLPGARAPRVLTAEDVRDMRPGSVVVDIAIDQGGCFETSRETRHSDPTYTVDGVVHYAVGNIPGAVPRTSTFALANSTIPYVRLLADHGLEVAIERRPELGEGINTRGGAITNETVRSALDG